MKVTIDKNSDTVEIKYPCLMISERGAIVLMKRHKQGTRVDMDGGESNFDGGESNFGYYSEGWDMDIFVPFKGAVTLENGND